MTSSRFELKTQKQPGWYARWQWWAWGLGWLLALIGTLFLWQARPETSLSLGPATGETHLSGANSFVGVMRQNGFGPLDSDKRSQLVEPGAKLRAGVFGYRPLVLQIEISQGRGPLQITANEVVIATITGPDLAGRYQLRFTPQRPVIDRPELYLRFDAPEAFRLTGLSLDLSEQWQPILSETADGWLILGTILLGLAALVGAAVGSRLVPSGLGWLGLALTLGAFWAWLNRLALQISVGPSGEMNAVVYWGWLGSTLYLTGFALAFGGWGLSVIGGQSLGGLAAGRVRPLARRYPFGAVVIFLGLFNALLTLLFFSVVVLQNNSFDNLARFWDGPEYLIIAHSLYSPTDPLLQIQPHLAGKSTVYWTAHFPLYPVVVRLFAEVFGYIPALFIPNFFFGTGFALVLYRFLADFGYSRRPLWLASLSLFLPLRWLIYHSVGSSEAATLFFLLLSFYQFKRGHYWWAGLWGSAVVLTRPNGIFLYGGYGLLLGWQALLKAGLWGRGPEGEPAQEIELAASLWRKVQTWLKEWWREFDWRAGIALSTMPLTLLGIFAFFGWRYGDFLAYLHIPESVTHVYPLPLLSMDVNVGRSEGDFYYYILEAAGLVLLWRERRYDLFWVGLAFTLPTVFMLHDDILRYSLLAFPFVLLIPFAAVLESKPARWLAPLALLGVLIYSWSQLNTNMIDLESWRAILKILN